MDSPTGPYAPLYHVKVKADGLTDVIMSIENGLAAIDDLGNVLDKYLEMMRAQAVVNVSGTSVSYSGGTFIVNRVTGKLSQSMQVMKTNPLTGFLVNTANYAAAVHDGHPAINMKKYLPYGTVVPMRKGKNDEGATKIAKRDAKGRVRSYEYIMFRRVGKTGWIIPAAKGRPYLLAAAEKFEPALAAEVADAIKYHIEGDQ